MESTKIIESTKGSAKDAMNEGIFFDAAQKFESVIWSIRLVNHTHESNCMNQKITQKHHVNLGVSNSLVYMKLHEPKMNNFWLV